MKHLNGITTLGPKHTFWALAIGISVFLSLGATACTGAKGGGLDSPLVIEGELSACTADSIRLFVMNGSFPKQVAAAKLVQDGGKSTFSLSAKLPRKGVYALGDDPRRSASFLLEGGGSMTLSGNCQNPVGTYKLRMMLMSFCRAV